MGHNAGIVKRKFQNGIHALLPFFLRGSIKKGIVGQRIRAKLSAQHSGNLPGAFFVQRIKLKGRVGGVKCFVRIVQQLAEHAAAGSVVAVNHGIGRSSGVWRGKAAALIQKQRSGGGIQSVKPAAQVITVVCLNHRVVNVGAVDAQPACKVGILGVKLLILRQNIRRLGGIRAWMRRGGRVDITVRTFGGGQHIHRCGPRGNGNRGGGGLLR